MAEFDAFADDVPLPEPTDPATDPVGTVRCEDWSRRLDPDARRAIRVSPDLVSGCRGVWMQFTGPPSLGSWWADDEVRDWHVAPLLTVAVAFRHSARPAAPAGSLDGGDAEGAAPFKDGR